MMNPLTEESPRPRARIAGVVYLLYFLTAISGEVFVGRKHLIAYDTVDLTAHAFYIALALLFYHLFRPVNRHVSLLAACFSLAGCTNDILYLFSLIPKINSLAFFGPYCILIGYLIFRSTFLPRILGVLMILAGLGWLLFLTPFAQHPLSKYLEVLGFIAEAALMLWLIVKGVDVQRWKEQASASAQGRTSSQTAT